MMRTLDDLKAKATAAETTLIDAVVKAVENKVGKEMVERLGVALHNNPPPADFDMHLQRDPETYRAWACKIKDLMLGYGDDNTRRRPS